MPVIFGKPRISVVVATRNRLPQLKKALPTMMYQEGVHEVLVGDSGSTDGTKQWLKKKNIPFVDFEAHAYTLNPAFVYDRLIRKASGEIIIWSGGEIHCNDRRAAIKLAAYCLPNTIAVARVYNRKKPVTKYTVCPNWKITDDRDTWKLHGHDNYEYSGPRRPVPLMFFGAFLRNIWFETKGYDRTLASGVDVEFAERAMRLGIKFVGVGSVTVTHLTHRKV